MKAIIYNDEILAHSSYYCFNRTWYKLDEEGYYYCTNCNFKCPSILITLPKTYMYFFKKEPEPVYGLYAPYPKLLKKEIFEL